MKPLLTLVLICFGFFYILIFTPAIADTSGSNLSARRIKLLNEFKQMYEQKHFKPFLFNLKEGYLQTAIAKNDKKMPLTYFVKYNNIWWFHIISKVEVPSVAYDPNAGIGFIILNIYYGKAHILRAMQYVKFKNDKITYIRTYGSPTFWDSNDPLITLDRYGNEIFLATGYNLDYSAKAASYFFESPVGKSFASNPETSYAVKQIKSSLGDYLNHKRVLNVNYYFRSYCIIGKSHYL